MRFLLLFLILLGTLAGRPGRGTSPRVLVFLETECPISQKVTRRVQALAGAYAGRVMFETVYPTETVTRREITAFQRTYALRLTPHPDPRHKLVNRYDATTTPEVILLSADDQTLYRGPVDNQFYKLGKYRPAPTEFYLKNAIDATLNGRPVAVVKVTPVGCLINRTN